MAIRNTTSTLPDPEYIRQLEIELRELRKIAEQALEIAKAASQGR
jgi:hypothetical protein